MQMVPLPGLAHANGTAASGGWKEEIHLYIYSFHGSGMESCQEHGPAHIPLMVTNYFCSFHCLGISKYNKYGQHTSLVPCTLLHLVYDSSFLILSLIYSVSKICAVLVKNQKH